jgi:ribonucleoside-diphosphate reductase alpha chain
VYELRSGEFRNDTAARIFEKYANPETPTWKDKTEVLLHEVGGPSFNAPAILPLGQRKDMAHMMQQWKFVTGGRYLYYAGRGANFYNNCYLLGMEEDTREEWSEIVWRAMRCLMVGGGIGCDYSTLRPSGARLHRTGGIASGPLPLMVAIDQIGRAAVQGGGRRAAIYASLNWKHDDVRDFIHMKDWHNQYIGDEITVADLKRLDPEYHAPMNFTNISVNFDDDWLHQLERWDNEIFMEVVRNAILTSEPGFSFNFGSQQDETYRNACTEITSADDSDVCNLGSINLAACSTDEIYDVSWHLAQLLIAGTLRAELPYEKVARVREKNRRIGVGLMGVGEWFIQRGLPYGKMTAEFKQILNAWREGTVNGANELCDRLEISRPVAYNAIAPTGSISMLAGATSGAEPMYASAYKRYYYDTGMRRRYEFFVDSGMEEMVEQYGIDPNTVDTALSLSTEEGGLERRIAFQANLQDYVDHAISSTINLPATIEEEDTYIQDASRLISEYAPRLRGLTFYRDGSRFGQPIEAVPWDEAIAKKNVVHEVNEICEISEHGGFCQS